MNMIMLLIIVAAMVACAPQCKYTRPGGTQMEWEQDVLRCQYEAELAVNAPSGQYSDIFVSSLEMALRQSELIKKCLQVKGWKCEVQR